MRKALFLTRHFPPLVTSASSRAWKLASNLSTIGWQPIVVAPPAIAGMEATLPSGANTVGDVRRTGAEIDASTLEASGRSALLHGRHVASMLPITARLSGLFRDDPDAEAWEKAATAEVERLLAAHPDIDLLYAQGPPIEPLMIALETARKHHLTVVLDITAPLDPAMPEPGASGSSSAAEAEARILLSGVPMLIPTRALKEYFLKKYIGRLDHGSMTIVPPAFDATHPVFRQPGAVASDGVMRVALLVDELPKSDCKAVVAGLEAWLKSDGVPTGAIRMTFFGEGSSEIARRTAKSPVKPMLLFDPAASLGEQLEHCRKAGIFCALLGRTPANACTVPDRFADAIGMGKPLFAVLPDGAAARLVADSGGVTANAGDARAIAGLFSSMYQAFRTGTLRAASGELAGRHAVGAVIPELKRAIAGQHVR